MITADGIQAIYDFLKEKDSSLKVFKYDRPLTDDFDENEYIVINSLGLPSDLLQIGVFNINVHVKDIQGIINNNRIETLTRSVVGWLEAYRPDLTQENYIDLIFESENTLPEVGLKEHYSNIRVKAVLLND